MHRDDVSMAVLGGTFLPERRFTRFHPLIHGEVSAGELATLLVEDDVEHLLLPRDEDGVEAEIATELHEFHL